VHDPESGFDEAAAFAASEGVGRRDRRVIEREAAAPIPANAPDGRPGPGAHRRR